MSSFTLTHSISLPFCDRNGIVISDHQSSEPSLFKLRARGTPEGNEILHDLPRWGLGIVGTRKCTASAKENLFHMLRPFAGSPLVVISGFAKGVDRLAHETAIQLGLRTVAILGSGLDRCYPPEHKTLQQEILQNHGLLLSPFHDFESPRPFHFLKRNRLIAELSHAIWIVEAPFKSGAMNTASHAVNLERKLLVTPAHPRNENFSGNLSLLKSGKADPLWQPEDLLSSFSHLPLSERAAKKNYSSEGHPSEYSRNRLIQPLLHYLSLQSEWTSGVSLTQLQEWWMEQGWTPTEFFETLQEALRNGWITKENGVFLKKEF